MQCSQREAEFSLAVTWYPVKIHNSPLTAESVMSPALLLPDFSPINSPVLRCQHAFRSSALPLTDVLESAPLKRVSFPQCPQEGVFPSAISRTGDLPNAGKTKTVRREQTSRKTYADLFILFMFFVLVDTFNIKYIYILHTSHHSPCFSRVLTSQALPSELCLRGSGGSCWRILCYVHTCSNLLNKPFPEFVKKNIISASKETKKSEVNIGWTPLYNCRHSFICESFHFLLLWFLFVGQDDLRCSSCKKGG